MKFKSKAIEVDVGAVDAASGNYMPGTHPLVVIDPRGKATLVTPDTLAAWFEPADGDAEVWLEGMKQRVSDQRRAMFPPPEPEAFELRDPEDDEGRRIEIRPIRPKRP